MVAALITASTCGNSRMTFMAASNVAAHFQHEADIHRESHSDEYDQHDPVAPLNVWVKVCHVDFVGPLELRPLERRAAFEPPGLDAPPQQDFGEHRREQDE